MRWRLISFDRSVLFSALTLSVLGLIVIASLDLTLFFRQLTFFFLGVFLFFIFSLIDYRIFSRLVHLFLIFSLVFLLTPLIFGQITRGALRWIRIGDFTLQPTELVKPFLIIFFKSSSNGCSEFGNFKEMSR